MQSNRSSKLHVGIIMDGNGRWATRRRLSRLRGHEAGVEAIRRVVEAAPKQDVGTLTLYAFSSDNWRRPQAEVSALMGLLRFYLASEVEGLVRNGVRLNVIGRRDRLPAGIADAIGRAERRPRTATCCICASRSITPPATPSSMPPRMPPDRATSPARAFPGSSPANRACATSTS